MNYIYTHTADTMANAILNNRHIKVMPAPVKHNMPTVAADDLATAITAFGAVPYTAPVPTPKSLTKRELVDKLIEAGIAEQFSALLANLPPAEKLRWEASPTISPDYPYIRDNRTKLCTLLNITEAQLDALFQ